MALVLQDRVKETTTTVGTGTFTLGGTSTGFVSFAVIGNGNETYYTAVDNTTGAWEVGIGTYNTGTLTRDTVLASSDGGSKVAFAAGSKDVFVAYPAEKAVTLDTPQTLTGKTLVSANLGTPLAAILTNATGLPLSTGVTGTLPVSNGGTGATALTGYVKASGTSAFAAVATIPGSDVSGNISGNAANVTGVVAVANGGTAVTSAPANGQLLIGNGTGYTLATLTAGTGVSITNGAGTITINAPEVGTVTAVTATAPLASSGGNTPDISLTGTVGVANGGTGATTLTGYVKASGTAAFTAVAQIPNTDISGLGTMSTQNANNVAITGGSVNGTTVGLVTPSTGAFTTVSAASGFFGNLTGDVTGNVSGNAGTVTNGVYTTGDQTIGGTKTFTSTITGSITGNAGTVTNGVYTTGSYADPTWITSLSGSKISGNISGNAANVTGTVAVGNGGTGITSGTSGGVPYFSSTSTIASSAALAANSLVVGGGAGVAPSTTATGTGVLTALGTNVGSAGAFVVNGGALGTPSSGTVTNLTGTASININGTVGATTPNTGSFTSLTNSGNLTFSSTGQRITGDMSNATQANRLAFQTSTTNGNTSVFAIPNGTGTLSQFGAFSNSDPTNASAILIAQVGTTESRIVAGASGTGTLTPMTFFTNNAERMRLDTSGNLGIGTASPSTKLDVVGTSRYTFNVANAYTLQTSINAAGSAFADDYKNALSHIWQTSGTERMRIDSSGNVGIGTTPSYRLHVAATAPTNSILAYLTNSQGGSTRSRVALQDASTTFAPDLGSVGNNITFDTVGAERMRIDSSGNVGIGTASPGSFDPSADNLVVGGGSGDTGISIYSGTTGSGRLMFADGTSGDGPYVGQIHYDHSSNYMRFITNGGERMRITSDGEVYIAGTTDQGAYNLQCNGTGVWGAGAYVNGSDARLKDNIQSLDSGLDVVKAMRPVTFQYKPEYSKDQSVQPGFIAQELQEAMAGKPYLDGVVQEGPNHLNVAYQGIIPILVKAMQEQQDQIKALQDKIAALEAK